MKELIHKELTDKIIRAAIEVHKALGSGFVESIYECALCIELAHLRLCFERQKQIRIFYRDQLVGIHRMDLLVEDTVIVELKAIAEFPPDSFARIKSYLKATGMRVGLLLNFGKPTLGIKRFVL